MSPRFGSKPTLHQHCGLIMSLVVLDHIRGLKISLNDILYICKMRSRIPQEWYLSPRSGMSGFIIRASCTNKDLDRGILRCLEIGNSEHLSPQVSLTFQEFMVL